MPGDQLAESRRANITVNEHNHQSSIQPPHSPFFRKALKHESSHHPPPGCLPDSRHGHALLLPVASWCHPLEKIFPRNWHGVVRAWWSHSRPGWKFTPANRWLFP
jgi:hypothetical protein